MQEYVELRSVRLANRSHRRREIKSLLGYVALAVSLGAAVTQGLILPALIAGVVAALLIWQVSEMQSIIVLVLGLIFIDRSPIVVHQSYVRLYQVFSIPIIARWAMLRIVHRERILIPKGVGWALVWLLSFVMAYPILVSRTEFFVEFLGMAYLLLLEVVVCDTIARYQCWSEALWATTVSGLIVVVSGLVQYPLLLTHILHTTTYGGFVRPYGLMREPDWYGVASGITLLLVIHHRDRFSSRWYWAFLLGSLIGVLASLARASWLSLGIAMAVLAIVPGPDQKVARQYIKYGIVVSFAFAVLLAVVDFQFVLAVIARFSPISIGIEAQAHILAQQAWDSRLASIRLMLYLIRLHPWIGNGAGIMGKLSSLPSIQSMFAYGGQLNTGRATTNVFLAQLASVGIIGSIPFVVWIFQGLIRGFKSSWYGPIIGAILLLCFVDFQFNSGTGYGFFWVFMGMAGMGAATGKS
ncbi:MAG: hypothetical protein C7B46_10115 [Sulfobacillus benefaciens]|uniref:O-antigen ligase domain-containing protein n=1 Tax=Sulfobacillus benefaciens TaxID=453960 RepID=A0A2T2XG38_9FIRM|nr:MAG: hypothetical protein C7B46_10115 [Sulfobacillus benefaciens]